MSHQDWPLISIATCCYNQGNYLEENILSVMAQGYPNYQHIVIDDGSTDSTSEVIRKYPHVDGEWQPNRGQCNALNKAFRKARGELVGWLNSDDTYVSGAFYQVADFFRGHPEADMVYGEGYHVDVNGEVLEPYPTEHPFNVERLKEVCFICQPSVWLRPSVFAKIGYLDENLRYCMDYDLWIRAAKAGLNIAYLPHFLASTRIHEQANTIAKRRSNHDEILRMLKKHYSTPCSKWVFNYAHAVVDQFLTRETSFKDWIYVMLVCVISVYKFLRQYKTMPAADLATMAGWLRGTTRALFGPARRHCRLP